MGGEKEINISQGKGERIQIMLKNENGSVIMEYAIVVSLMAIAVVSFWYTSVYSIDPATGEGEFVGAGLALQGFFQELVNGIALPIP